MTPLFKKLNLGEFKKILVLNSPATFESELVQLDGIKVLRRRPTQPTVKFAIGFAVTQSQLDEVSRKLTESTQGDAIVWVAYPKKSSRKYKSEINRDCGWKVLGDAGFEGVRQVAIDEDWSALRFRRTEYIISLTRNNAMAISNAGKRRTQ